MRPVFAAPELQAVKRTFDNPVLIGVGLMVALLLLTAGLTYRNTRQLHEDAGLVAHTHEVQNLTSDVMLALVDAETGYRGFLIIGKDEYLQPYDAALVRLDGLMAKLKDETKDNSGQQSRITKLEEMSAVRLAFLKQGIDLRRKNAEEALAFIAAGKGKAQMDAIRQHVADMQKVEGDLLKEWEGKTARTYRDAVTTGLLTAVLGLATVGAFVWLLNRSLRTRQEATAVIAEQGERLRTTLASIGDAVISTDTEGRITNLNGVAESLTGWTDAEAMGQPLDAVFRIVNEETRQPVLNPATRALKEGVIVGLANHTILIAKDDTERCIDDSAAPIRCKDGEIVGCVLIFRDVSPQRQAARRLAESEARKTAMFQAALDCIISIDHAGTIIEFNPAAEATFGHRRDDVLGKELAALIIPPAYRERYRQGLARCLATGEGPVLNQRLELWVLRADGSEFPVELTVTRLAADGPPLFTAYLRDITARKLAEAALRESNERVTNIVESITDAFVTLDKEWRFTFLNQRAQEILFPLQEPGQSLLGKNLWQEYPDVVGTLVEENYRRCMNEQVTVGFELYYPPLHGWFEVRAYPSKDGLSIYFQDITDRKRAEEALRESDERLRNLADNIPQLAWIADAGTEGKASWFNKTWLDYTGTTIEQMQGSGWKSVHHPDYIEAVASKFEYHVKNCLDWEDTFPLRGKDGQFRWFLSRMKVIRDASGAVTRIFGTNTDVTQQREMADELRQLAAELSEADRRKNEFLAMLAHELRNPLAPIRNALQILRLAGGDGEAIGSASEMMERQVGQMVRLVDDLLDVSRISRGKIQLRRGRIELTSAIQPAIEAALVLFKSMGHELTVTLPPDPVYLDADPTRLNQAVGNLLNNACKFTDKGGRISLTVERVDGQAMIRVRDNGIGIAADQLPRIFEMFTQLDTSLERSQGGLGIGLTLVKRLVEMHGGAVEVHSAGVGQGSEFTVRLPTMAEAPKPLPPEPTALEPRPPRTLARRILVVDDNRDAALSLAMVFKLTGNQTQTAHDGAEAVEKAAAYKPDVILLDIGLPKLNGYEAARWIREQPWGRNILMIALTGWGQEEDRRKSKEAGFDAHLVKPVDHPALEKLLAELQAAKAHAGAIRPT